MAQTIASGQVDLYPRRLDGLIAQMRQDVGAWLFLVPTLAFFVGYQVAAVGPVAAGALRDATGGFTAVFATLAVLGLGTLVLGLSAGRSRVPGPSSP